MAKGSHARPRGSGRPEPEPGAAGQTNGLGGGRAAARRPRRLPPGLDGTAPARGPFEPATPAEPGYESRPRFDAIPPAEHRLDGNQAAAHGYDRDGSGAGGYGGDGEPAAEWSYDPERDPHRFDPELGVRGYHGAGVPLPGGPTTPYRARVPPREPPDDGYPGPLFRGDGRDEPEYQPELDPDTDLPGSPGGPDGPGGPGGPRMGRARRRKAERKPGSLWRELPMLVGIAIILALLIKTFLVQAFYIPSDSMENTLLRGDRVLVNKLGAHFGDPGRGEVVVFRDPGGWLSNGDAGQPSNPIIRGIKKTLVFIGLLPSDNQQDLIKRVIGLSGDRVKCCDDKGRVTVNGEPLDEPYVYPDNPPSDSTFDVTVPPGRLWVMGDHRSVSADSRVHMAEEGEGTIPMGNVVGRAFVIVWPLGRAGGLGVPDTFDGDRIDRARTEPAALTSALASVAAVPPLLWGLAGAVPIVAIRRRWRLRHSRA